MVKFASDAASRIAELRKENERLRRENLALKAQQRSLARKAGRKIIHGFRRTRTSLSAKAAKLFPPCRSAPSPGQSTTANTTTGPEAHPAIFGSQRFRYREGELEFEADLFGECGGWVVSWEAAQETPGRGLPDNEATPECADVSDSEDTATTDDSAWDSPANGSETTDATSVCNSTSSAPASEHTSEPNAGQGIRIPGKKGHKVLATALDSIRASIWEAAKKHWPDFVQKAEIQDGPYLVKLGWTEMGDYRKLGLFENWETRHELYDVLTTCISKARNAIAHPEVKRLTSFNCLDWYLWNIQEALRLLGDSPRCEEIQRLRDDLRQEAQVVMARLESLDGLIVLPFTDCRAEEVSSRDGTDGQDCGECGDDWDEGTLKLLHSHDRMLCDIIRGCFWHDKWENSWGKHGHIWRIGMYYIGRADAGEHCTELRNGEVHDW